MRINKTLILAIIAVMGLSFQWLQSRTQKSQLHFEQTENLTVLDEIIPFARKAGQAIEENKSFRNAKLAIQNFRGRLVGQAHKAVTAVAAAVLPDTEEQTQAHEEKKALDPKLEAETAAMLAEKAKEKEEEEKEVIGYDAEGNPIYAHTEEGEEGADGKTDEDELAESEELNPEEASELADSDKKETEKKDTDDSGVPSSTIVSVTEAAPADVANEDENLAYEEWARLILTQPDPLAVSKFIEYYQSGRIAKEDFYRLVSEMMADSRAPLRKLGATALGSTPSIESFTMMADIYESEPFGTDIGESIRVYLDQYSTLTYLRVLEAVLTSNSPTITPTARNRAIEKLNKATNRYIGRDTASHDQDEDGENNALEQYTTAQMHFFKFAAALESFLESSPSPETSGFAEDALTNLRQVLNFNPNV